MMQYAGANDQVKAMVQITGVLDRELPRFQIRLVVLSLQLFSVFETCRRDINTNHAGGGMTDCLLC